MRWLVALSLRNRIVVAALAVLLVVGAVRTLRTTPLDVFPEFAPPLVEVQTEAPGLSTNDVEALVTVPLEAALNGVPGLDRIRSKSVLGLSSVVLILDPATDVMTSRQMVQERLSRAIPTLPAVARPPVMLSPLSSLSRVMKIGLPLLARSAKGHQLLRRVQIPYPGKRLATFAFLPLAVSAALTLLAATHETKVTVAETREMICALVILTFLVLAARAVAPHK